MKTNISKPAVGLMISCLLAYFSFFQRSCAAEIASISREGLVGHWEGALTANPFVKLHLALDVTNASGKYEGTLISVDQGNASIPLTSLTETSGVVYLEAKIINGIFNGKLSPDGSEIAGTWKQVGQTLPLIFKRTAHLSNFNHPQEPKKPYPYDEEEVIFTNASASVQLGGTLTRPRTPGPHPAVVLISGSGQHNRDETVMGHRPFLVLADHLTRNGIAVLRNDNRGVGRSLGNFASATDLDFVSDTIASVVYLRSLEGIDPKRIGLIGHSEGGIVASLAAVKCKDISFIVLLAAPGVPMDQLLERQGQDLWRFMGLGDELESKYTTLQRNMFRILKEEKDLDVAKAKLKKLYQDQAAQLTDGQRKSIGLTEEAIDRQIQLFLSPWFRQLLLYDPRSTLKLIKCPVLALDGEKDLQVSAKENLPAIREALMAGGNQKIKTVELPGLNHLFQACQTGAISEYGQIEETFNPTALNSISDWILEITREIPHKQ